MKLTITSIIPIIRAIIDFNLGLPGALIQRARFGFKKAPIPKSNTIAPETNRMIFIVSMLSTSVLLLFHMQVFPLLHPLLLRS